DVLVVGRKRTYHRTWSHLRQSCHTCFHNGCNVIVHLLFLPEKALVLLFDFSPSAYRAVLISHEEVEVQLPLQFVRTSLPLSFGKVFLYLRNNFITKQLIGNHSSTISLIVSLLRFNAFLTAFV